MTRSSVLVQTNAKTLIYSTPKVHCISVPPHPLKTASSHEFTTTNL